MNTAQTLVVREVEDLVGVYELVDITETIKNKVNNLKRRAKAKLRKIAFRVFLFHNNHPEIYIALYTFVHALIGAYAGIGIGKLILLILAL